MDLQGRTVLVTGASSGIGAATARALARKGARLVLVARRENLVYCLAKELTAQGASATPYAVDLRDSDAVVRLAATVRRDIGTPDIIINNAGAGRWLPLHETSAEEARRMIEVPYLAALYVTREFLADMMNRRSGHIVNITSPGSLIVWPNACGYIASRHALRGFTEALREDLRKSGIHVTLVVLGKVSSSYWENNPGSEQRVPKLLPLFAPTLTTDQAATVVLQSIVRGKGEVVSPPIFRFLLHPLFPDLLLRWISRYPTT